MIPCNCKLVSRFVQLFNNPLKDKEKIFKTWNNPILRVSKSSLQSHLLWVTLFVRNNLKCLAQQKSIKKKIRKT